MNTRWLQRFLNAGLLDIGDDDVKLTFLRDASGDVAKMLVGSPSLIPRYTLVALDSEIPADEPVLEQTEQAIIGHWNTLRNRFPDRPRVLIRAVILEALGIAAAEDNPKFAAIIWLTGASFLPHIRGTGQSGLLEEFLLELGTKAEEAAAHAWSPKVPDPPRIQSPLIKAENLPIGSVDLEALEDGLAAAAGPQRQDGRAQQNANPHWPNQAPHWSYQFAPRAAKAISASLDGAIQKNANGVAGALESLLRDHAKAVRAAIKTTMEHVGNAIAVEQRRAALLWWRKTLYSPSAQQGYRQMPAAVASFLMAADLAGLIVPNAPRSVEYLLREAVRDVAIRSLDQALPSVSIPSFCEALRRGLPKIKGVGAPSSDVGDGRIPFATYVRQQIAGDEKVPEETLRWRVGVAPEQDFQLDDLAVWLFRDLQAEAIATAEAAS